MNSESEDIKAELIREMKARDWKPSDLVRFTGIKAPTLSDVLTGKQKANASHLAKLRAAIANEREKLSESEHGKGTSMSNQSPVLKRFEIEFQNMRVCFDFADDAERKRIMDDAREMLADLRSTAPAKPSSRNAEKGAATAEKHAEMELPPRNPQVSP